MTQFKCYRRNFIPHSRLVMRKNQYRYVLPFIFMKLEVFHDARINMHHATANDHLQDVASIFKEHILDKDSFLLNISA